MSVNRQTWQDLKVVVLAGGVGGAKLVVGLDRILPPENLVVVVNTGDDFTHLGLNISPDLDSVCYALARISDQAHGWGRQDDTRNVLQALEELGAPTWFALGDKDLATHLERTRLLGEGKTLTEATARLCRCWGIEPVVLPMNDSPCPTRIETSSGEILSFQDYFVRLACEPTVKRILLPGPDSLPEPTRVIEALNACQLVVFTPSNPWVSLDPILNMPGVREAVAHKPAIAVSPIIQGRAVKGPAARMFHDLGIEPTSRAVAEHYASLVRGFVHDILDEHEFHGAQFKDIIISQTNTMMKTTRDKAELASFVLAAGLELIQTAGEDADLGNRPG